MNGLAKPAKGQVDPSSPWFGKPTFELKYDVAAAKKLVQEAGYSKEKPLKTTFVIAQGGTGQMLSLPMNEFLQQTGWSRIERKAVSLRFEALPFARSAVPNALVQAQTGNFNWIRPCQSSVCGRNTVPSTGHLAVTRPLFWHSALSLTHPSSNSF